MVRGLVCEIELPPGMTLESGKQREELGQLEGRAYTPSAAIRIFGGDDTSHRIKVEWLVRAPVGGEVGLTARHDRAGVARARLSLG